MPLPIVLSHFQAKALLSARVAGQAFVQISPDLGLSQVIATVTSEGVGLAPQVQLTWAQVHTIAAAPNACFALQAGELHKLQRYSEVTERFCSLLPTGAAPALLVAGFPMHRIKNTDPQQDTLSKVHTLAPLVGSVLDTATGLGYTAIQASLTADHVITIELDPAVLALARFNPWSHALFDNPRIEQRVGDSCDEVATFPDGAFARILHDPPTVSLAGELYSGAFYAQLYRVLARGGRLFHYLGDSDSRLGQRVTRGAVQRLQAAGFSRVRAAQRAFGVVAYK